MHKERGDGHFEEHEALRGTYFGRCRHRSAVTCRALWLFASERGRQPDTAGGAVQTQKEVTSLLANLPLAWLKSDATDVPTNDYSYCENVIDTGPSGSAAWTYGLGFDLVEPMSNVELLKLLTPSGDQWVLRPEQSIAGSTKKPSIEKSRTMYLIYDAPDMTIVVFLNAESSTRPRVAVSASTSCIRNGDTGPGTFPAPTPTSVPVPSAAP